MFAKLKKKIQDEDGSSPGRSPSAEGDFRPATKLPSPGPGIASPVKLEFPVSNSVRRESARDFETASMSSEISDVKDTASKEDMLKKIFKKNDQIKKLESKISELAVMIKDRNRNIEKLEKSIEKQKEESSSKVEELTSKLEEEKQKCSVEGTEVLRSRITDLEQENASLTKRVLESEVERRKLLKEEEEKEEMVGLNTQENAKVKHMLLNIQADLQQTQKELSDKTNKLLASQTQVKDLENEVSSLMQQISHITTRSENLEEETKQHKLILDQLHGDHQELSNETIEEENLRNKSMLDQLQGVKQELTVRSGDLKTARESLDQVQHSLDVLQRNSDMHQSKMTKLVEEKDEHISHLRERIESLEQRLRDGGLSGDDRIQAAEKQRTTLEQKLSEAREQLSQVKSSWSDKISHLETQISHLNRKIAEDNEELVCSRKEVESVRDRFHKQIEALQSNLDQSEKACKEHLDTIDAKELSLRKLQKDHSSEMLREKLHWTSLETELREKITDLHKDLDLLQRTREQDKQQNQLKLSKLENNQEEWLEKEIDAEKQITGLENMIEKLKVKLQDRDRQIEEGGQREEIINKLKAQIKELEESLKTEQKRITELQQEVQNLDKECRNSNEEKDTSLLRNAQLSQEFESFKRRVKDQHSDLETELQEKNHSIAGLEQVLVDMQQEAETAKKKMTELESQQMVAITEIESEEIKKLQEQILDSDEQLLDRNRTIKKLHRGMADLKKTLQRELNVQALPNDEMQKETKSATNGQLQTPNVYNNISTKSAAFQNSYESSAGVHVNSFGSLPVTSSVTVNLDKRKFYEGASDFSASDLENIAISMTNNKNGGKTNSRMYAGVQYDRDINFEYLKHVIMKFILSRETESVHLVKAVGVLLDMNQDEQKLMRDTLEYRMSWFGTKPSLGRGQFSKFIPPAL